jgi:hypothetical protein
MSKPQRICYTCCFSWNVSNTLHTFLTLQINFVLSSRANKKAEQQDDYDQFPHNVKLLCFGDLVFNSAAYLIAPCDVVHSVSCLHCLVKNERINDLAISFSFLV